MTPLVEEPLKLAAFIFAVYVVPTKSYKGLLLVAITAGLGFQISEDFSYILSDLPDGFSYTISGILGRTIGAVSSHWLYTSFLAMGLVLIWRSRQKLISSKYSLIDMLYACGAFAAHLLEIYLFEIQKAICHGHQVFLFHSIFSSSLHFIRSSRNWMKKTSNVKLRKKNFPILWKGFFDDFNHSQKNDWSSDYQHHLRLLPIVYLFKYSQISETVSPPVERSNSGGRE